MRGRLLGVHHGVSGNDDLVPRLHTPCGRAIEGDLTGFAIDDIGGEPRAIGHVVNIDAFPFEDIGALAQRAVDRNGTLLVEVCTGHRGAVNLGFEQLYEHFYEIEKMNVSRPPTTECRKARGYSTDNRGVQRK